MYSYSVFSHPHLYPAFLFNCLIFLVELDAYPPGITNRCKLHCFIIMKYKQPKQKCVPVTYVVAAKKKGDRSIYLKTKIIFSGQPQLFFYWLVYNNSVEQVISYNYLMCACSSLLYTRRLHCQRLDIQNPLVKFGGGRVEGFCCLFFKA